MAALRRNYIVAGDVSGTEPTQAQMALAEQLIDQYVGWQRKHIELEYYGEVSSHNAITKTIYDTGNGTQLGVTDGFFARCVIEIIGGTGDGSYRVLTGSDKDDKSVTYEGDALTIDTTSRFKIYQLAKFPRFRDAYVSRDGDAYYKTIPEVVKEATAAQAQFIVANPTMFDGSSGGSMDMQSERIGDYSYSRGNEGGTGLLPRLIAPKARALLRGIRNVTGRIVADDQRRGW